MALLRMQPGNVELTVHENESILDAIIRGGYTCRFGCRRGGCGQCKADLVSGEVEYRKKVADSVLSEEERADGVVLTCRTHPVSDEVVLQMRHTEKFKLFVPLAYAMGQVEVTAHKLKAAGIHISLQVNSDAK
ncbi:2Fe-2S iron-sulfur cluster-binding protein [[Mycobacterium] crassicus]|uniref:2Fe-2S iron-sulfur cluster-binding protein n=1 Tax=[Mycobacterium] crassicus TaxID=2872309 RepID=A0ABU5XLY9_9MYCO|nr:2Fe-2S iron-sulfur cluster-binding protein [Mycolicibacter sp. MYC098]MEB3022121.1 2Fe-2S iron-sulfur cluster-binding protein [Mycolicibacter sp. MYC098]